MQKRNQCLFLRIKISLIGHFNKPVFESFLDELLVFFLPISNVYCFLFRKLHINIGCKWGENYQCNLLAVIGKLVMIGKTLEFLVLFLPISNVHCFVIQKIT